MKRILSLLLSLLALCTLLLGICSCGEESVENFILFYSDGELYATVKADPDGKIVLPSEPQKDGFVFGGWYFDKDVYTSELTADVYVDFSRLSKAKVYAKWIEKSNQ